MSVSLYYHSGTVSPDQRRLAEDRIASWNEGYEYWCESLGFEPDQGDSSLAGSTKLYCGIADERVDFYMAHTDLMRMIGQLERLSTELGVEWSLNIDGKELGRIIGGEVDDELEFQLDVLGDMHGAHKPFDLSREEILERHSDR